MSSIRAISFQVNIMLGVFTRVMVAPLIRTCGTADNGFHVLPKERLHFFWQLVNGQLGDGPVHQKTPTAAKKKKAAQNNTDTRLSQKTHVENFGKGEGKRHRFYSI